MTREHKLALLIGFALVLVVGVVISDHFSGAGGAKLETLVADDDPSAPRQARMATINRVLETDPLENSQTVAATNQQDKTSLNEILREIGESARNMPPATATDPIGPRDAEENSEPAPVVIKMGLRPAAAHPATRTHRVAPGDTFWALADRYYDDPSLHDELAKHNNVSNSSLQVGQELAIPDVDDLMGRSPQRQVSAPKQANPPRIPAAKARRHTVKSGDTLGSIAADKLGSASRWSEIFDLNRDDIADPDMLTVGVELRLPE